MNRDIKKDFIAFTLFIENYNPSLNWNDENHLKDIKALHKYYYAFLVMVIEITESENIDADVSDRIKECCSDIGQSLFLFCQGVYKPSNLLIRCSIENFMKAIGLSVDKNIESKKYVFEIFDISKKYQGCRHPNFINQMGILTEEYGKLCKHTHTATNEQMSHIISFNILPYLDEEKSSSLIKCAKKVIKNYMLILIWSYKEIIFSSHHVNREIILDVFSTTEKKDLWRNKY